MFFTFLKMTLKHKAMTMKLLVQSIEKWLCVIWDLFTKTYHTRNFTIIFQYFKRKI